MLNFSMNIHLRLFIFLLLILAGCTAYKTVGGYTIYGQVIDSITLQPIEGVRVSSRFEAVSMYSNNTEVVASTITDVHGAYTMQIPKSRLWGGTGGLSGYISEYPSISYFKHGYCRSTSFYLEPELSKYQGAVTKLEKSINGKCL